MSTRICLPFITTSLDFKCGRSFPCMEYVDSTITVVHSYAFPNHSNHYEILGIYEMSHQMIQKRERNLLLRIFRKKASQVVVKF